MYESLREEDDVTIVIDGLDEYSGDLNEESASESAMKKDEVNAFVEDFLRKEYLPRAKLLISSREEALTNLPHDMRPQKTIKLAGFSADAIFEVAKQIVGDVEIARTIIKELKSHNQILYNLCSNPLFLTLIVRVYHKCLREKTRYPNTLCEVMLHLVASIQASKNSRKANIKYPEILENIYHLAYYISMEKRVVISSNDLKECGLDKSDIIDIVITTPSSYGVANDHIVEGDIQMSFIHRLFQDTFSCIHVMNLDIEEFKAFISNEITKSHWMVMWRLLCGYLLRTPAYTLRKRIVKGIVFN